jgi:hypothetical protein
MSEADMHRVFTKYGPIRDLVFYKENNPSAKVVCLIEYE